MSRPSFLNLTKDHTTFLTHPRLFRMRYVLERVLFKRSRKDIVYTVSSPWNKNDLMTFAVCVGRDSGEEDRALKQTIHAVVQPSEPDDVHSHVRKTLEDHRASVFIQHEALRTNDLFSLYAHLKRHGVNFITPILEDKECDLLQVFTGELFLPEGVPSGFFFEFVQRKVTDDLRKRLAGHHRETFFRDETFQGLYSIKERESQSGAVTPFINHELFELIERCFLEHKTVCDITDKDVAFIRAFMRGYARGMKGEKRSFKKENT